MKRYLSGLLTGLLLAGMLTTALAAQLQSISASLNSVNIEVNGVRQAAVGESYTLANGKDTAKTIVYNETTYVPIRYFGELMDVAIGWNQETSSVTIGEAPVAPEPTAAPDYSNWSAEDEAAYQEFKGMWEIKYTGRDTVDDPHYSPFFGLKDHYVATLKGDISPVDAFSQAQIDMFVNRLMNELVGDYGLVVDFLSQDGKDMLPAGVISDPAALKYREEY